MDDVVEAIERLIGKPPTKSAAAQGNDLDPAKSAAPWRVYNIGNNTAIEVSPVVELSERELGCKAKTEQMPMQRGDVPDTFAGVDDVMRDAGFRPSAPIEEGVRLFTAWYREFHK